jgi:hypothetical protein
MPCPGLFRVETDAGEVLDFETGSVYEIPAGHDPGLEFEDAGTHDLKGLSGVRSLFRLTRRKVDAATS